MALNGYFGKPGSGKSYSVVEYVVIPALKRGRHVVTNIPLEAELLTQVYGGNVTQLPLDVLDCEDLAELLPHGCVAVIDEVWRRWPSGQKVNRVSQSDLQLLKEHRHRVDAEGNAMQVVLVSQDPGDLAAWVRKLIAHSFHMAKLDSVGMDSKFSIKVYQGCPVGERIPSKLLIRDAVGTYRPEVYQYYRSATQSQASDLNVGDEKAMDKRANVWGSWQMKALLLMIPLCLFSGGYLFWYWVSMADRAAEKDAARHPERAQRLEAPEPPSLPSHLPGARPVGGTQANAVPPPEKPAAPPLSGTWRVVGFMRGVDAGEPENPGAWRSVTHYGVKADTGHDTSQWLGDLVVLRSWGGIRTVPASECQQMQASRYYSCVIDGELVTLWSGQQGASEVVGGKPLEAAKQGTTEVIGAQPVKEVKSATQAAPAASGAT